MNVDELLPTISNRIQFSLRYRKFAPNTPGCYVLTTFDGNVLYVGLTNNLYRRFSQHRDVKEKCDATTQGIAFWFYYLPAAEKEIHRIERGWLNQYQAVHGEFPILNKVSSPVK